MTSLIRGSGMGRLDPTDDKRDGRFAAFFQEVMKKVGLLAKEGANGRMGTLTLVAGTATVANTSITAATRIFLSKITNGGTAGNLTITRSVGVSFTVTSSSNTDTSTFDYLLVEPTA